MSDIDPTTFTGCMDHKPAPPPGLQVLPWICPCCDGLGRWESGERCMECTGFGLVEKKPDPAWGPKIRRAPRPPAVAPKMCRDCAFRRGSPEMENAGTQLPLDRPFFCHHGCQPTKTGYTPALSFDGMPLGERVCAGWWWAVTDDGEDPAGAAHFEDTHPHRDRP